MEGVKRVEAWVTSDGSTFSTERDARAHEAHTRLRDFYMKTSTAVPVTPSMFALWAMKNAEGLIHALRPLDTQSTPSA